MGKKIGWHLFQLIRIPNGYMANQMWYIRRSSQAQQIERMITTTEMVSQNTESQREIDQCRASALPLGLSVGVVSNKDPLPKCSDCDERLTRGANRILLTQITNSDRNWKQALSSTQNVTV